MLFFYMKRKGDFDTQGRFIVQTVLVNFFRLSKVDHIFVIACILCKSMQNN